MAGPEVAGPEVAESSAGEDAEQAAVYGNAYGTGSFHDRLGQAGIEDRCKTQAPTAAGGLFSKDRFGIDLDAGAVTCPGGITAPIRPARAGGGTAYFASACPQCPLRTQCTTAAGGRTVSVGPHEQTLTDARARQADPAWVADYRGTRPKVERKLGHLMRRRHGGRRARVRGTARVDADFRLLAAAVNLARMAVLDLRGSPQDGRWPSEQHKHAQPDKSADPAHPDPPPQQPQRLAWNLVPARPDRLRSPHDPSAHASAFPSRPLHTSHLGPV